MTPQTRTSTVVGEAGPAPSPTHPGAGEPALTVTGVTKAYGDGHSRLLALDHVSLEVAAGEFLCMVGASGCGKTTLLNLVAGLYKVDSGEIDTHGRRTALMFQESALFPWLTVRRNVEMAMRFGTTPRAQRRDRVAELLDLVNLGDFADKRPHELSGGMRQRVALARALGQEADLLLMDEPFGALDAMTCDLMHDELERIWSNGDLTVLFVTHNVREAVRLGDRVLLLTSRPGTVAEVFDVAMQRPRRMDDPEVSVLAGKVTDRLRHEVARHAR